MGDYRNRPLLDLAHEVHECKNCGCHVSHGCDPAHEAGIVAGKAQGTKSRDGRHAALCNKCHTWYDSGGTQMDPTGLYEPTRSGKAEMWNRAHKLTFDEYFRRGMLMVAPRPRWEPE